MSDHPNEPLRQRLYEAVEYLERWQAADNHRGHACDWADPELLEGEAPADARNAAVRVLAKVLDGPADGMEAIGASHVGNFLRAVVQTLGQVEQREEGARASVATCHRRWKAR